MTKRQSDKKITKQVRIEENLHRELKITAAKRSMQVTDLADEYVETGLEKDKEI